MPPPPAVSGRQKFWVQLAATLLLSFGTLGTISGLTAGDIGYVGPFALLMVLGMVVESYVYFLRARQGPDAKHR